MTQPQPSPPTSQPNALETKRLQSRFSWGLVFALLGTLAFSGKAIVVKLAYQYGVDSITLLMYRMLFALPLFLLLLAYSYSRDRKQGSKPSPIRAKEVWAIMGLGFTGYYLASFLDFWGLQYISVSLERLILYLNPTIVLLLNAIFFKKRVQAVQVLAVLLSYLGVVVVFGHEASWAGSKAGLGAGLVFASAISYALYLAWSGHLVKRFGSLRLASMASCFACGFCIAQFFILRPLSAAMVAPEVLYLSVFNAVFCTVLPVMMVMLAIDRIGSGLTAQMGMVGAMSTILLGYWVLGEPLNAWVGLGTVFVLVGVYMVSQYGERQK